MAAHRLACVVSVSLCTAIGGLALASATALAGSAPQAPVTGAASEVKGFSAMLNGELPLGGEASSYYFAYNTGESCEGGETTEPGSAASGDVNSEVSGLLPLTRYTFCLVATNQNGSTFGPGVSFETKRVPPAVERESFVDVGSGSVELTAQINAENTPSEYRFEYATGTEYAAGAKYGGATATTSLGMGHETVSVPAQLSGLDPDTEYHFRVAVTNSAGETVQGGDVVFKTLPAGILGLPDGRVFERVTPVENEGADVYIPKSFPYEALSESEGVPTEKPFQAAADGNAVAYPGEPSAGGIGTGGPGWGNMYLAKRSTAGWSQANIQPGGYFHATYQAFSSDLSVGFLASPSETGLERGLPPLSSEARGEGYYVLYGRSSSDGSYQPFFTKTADIHRSRGEFGAFNAGESGLGAEHPPVYAGSSADFGERLFEVDDALTAPAVEGASRIEYNLYVSVEGRLSVVNVLPDGVSEPDATFGSTSFEMEDGSGEDKRLPDFSHVISADGSRVFWTDLNTGALYLREDPTASDARTALVSKGGRFWTATADGSKAFFTQGDLYEYDVEMEGGRTTDLTPGVEVAGVVGASDNGEYVYYVASNDELELWHDGSSTAIAALSPEDGEEAGALLTSKTKHGDWQPGLGSRTAEVTPDGRGVVFMSNRSLKAVGYPDGYQNDGLDEVYVYEAEGGQLFCASCNSSGEPPQSNQETAAAFNPTAAFLPISFSDTYMQRSISEGGGRVFFDSAEPLVPQDTNDKQDVYEWERDGVGSCREANGCIYLLSGGTGGSASWLLDASSSGDDVFIISRTELVPGDPYESFDVYDARADGVPPLAPPACSGTGCQGVPPAPPIFATPASVTFDGVGDFPAPGGTAGSGKGQPKAKVPTRAQRLASALKVCRRQPKRKRTVCEARVRKRYGATVKARKSARSGEGR
jgi:hypothetical protein